MDTIDGVARISVPMLMLMLWEFRLLNRGKVGIMASRTGKGVCLYVGERKCHSMPTKR